MDEDRLAPLDGVLLDGLAFCAAAYRLFEEIRSLPDGVSRLRKRSRVEKRLIEELLPISAYVQSNYRPGRYLSIRWQSGNQQCDAELMQEGEYVRQGYFPALGFIEAVSVVHPNEHLMRELLESKGSAFGLEGIRRVTGGEIVSEPVSYSIGEVVSSYAALVLQEVSAKGAKAYPPNTVLVVQCFLNTLYMPNEWQSLMAQVSASMPHHPFSAVFFCESLGQYTHTVYPRRDA